MGTRLLTMVLAVLAVWAGRSAKGQQNSNAGKAGQKESRKSPIASPIRRVVTGKDATGKAIILKDGPATNIEEHTELGNAYTMMWVTDSTPADISGTADGAERKIGLEPPANGNIFRIVEFLPEKDIKADYATRLRIMKQRGVGPEGKSRDNPRHPGMHRTKTIDYALVMSGEIDMLLDDSEVHLKAGDVVIQRGTNHAWVNRGDKPCKIAFVLIDAKS